MSSSTTEVPATEVPATEVPKLPRATLFWVSADSSFSGGLYVSPTSVFFQEGRKKDGSDSYRFPDPWTWFYAPTMSGEQLDRYWTCLLPRQQRFDGFLKSLNSTTVETNTRGQWCIPPETVKEWEALDDFIFRCFKIVASKALIGLDTKVGRSHCPRPSEYVIGRCFEQKKWATSHVRKIRAVFMAWIVQLQFLGFVSAKRKAERSDWNSWVDWGYEHKHLSLSEVDNLRLSMVCTGSVDGQPMERIGLIYDGRVPLKGVIREDIDKLITPFSLPYWIYYGPTWNPHVNTSSYDVLGVKYFPSDDDVRRLMTTVEVKGVRTLTLADVSSSVPPSVDWPDSVSNARPTPYLPSTHVTTPHDVTRIPVNEQTGQRVNESHQEFFARMDERVRHAFATGTPEQIQLWTSRKEKHADLECPTREGKCNTLVFYWDVDENRTLLGRKRWAAAFAASTKAQRRYNPVSDQWDICSFLAPEMTEEEEEEMEEMEWSYFSQQDSSMDVDTPAPSGAIATTSYRPPSPPRVPSSSRRSASPSRYSSSRRSASPSRYSSSRRSPSPSRHPSSSRRRSPSPSRHPSSSRRRSPPRRYQSPPRRYQSPPRRYQSPPRRYPSPPRYPSSSRRHSPPRRYPSRPRPPSPSPRLSSPPRHSIPPPPRHQLPVRPPSPGPSALVPSGTANVTPKEKPDRVVLPSDDIRKTLRYRYGFQRLPTGFQLPQSKQFEKAYTKLKLHVAASALGHWMEALPDDQAEELRVYIACISAKVSLPPSLTDTLSDPPEHPYQLPHNFIVMPGRINREVWYIVDPSRRSERDVWYLVAIKDPLAVNQILRGSSAHTKYQLADVLVNAGIPFKTLRPYPHPRYLMLPPHPMLLFKHGVPLGLGVRSHTQSEFTLEDYEAYLERRNELITSSRGRAAFLRGGIVWRLARAEMDDHYSVLDGPSEYPTAADYVSFNGNGFVDDTLNEHELDVICGVYRLMPEPGTKHDGNSPSYRSWWPPVSQWEGSSFDIGYWNPSLEAWYQDRLAKIRDGSAGPKTALGWKSVLRHYEAFTRPMLETSRELAAKSLPRAPN